MGQPGMGSPRDDVDDDGGYIGIGYMRLFRTDLRVGVCCLGSFVAWSSSSECSLSCFPLET